MERQVDEFFDRIPKWNEELKELRSIILECGLDEEYKWMHPCYTFEGKNIVILGNFKDYCSISFFKGVLIKDEKGVLVAPTENMQSARIIKFASVKEIVELKDIIKTYIFEAIENEKKGVKVEFKKVSEFEVPEEFQTRLDNDAKLKEAFEALTPGRQKAYLLHFGGAKQSKTREARIDKYTQRILDGYGFNDCVCGMSKRMPNCDGSHNKLKK